MFDSQIAAAGAGRISHRRERSGRLTRNAATPANTPVNTAPARHFDPALARPFEPVDQQVALLRDGVDRERDRREQDKRDEHRKHERREHQWSGHESCRKLEMEGPKSDGQNGGPDKGRRKGRGRPQCERQKD